ncbi:NAD(P)-dependent oxidoreductase [Streptomyces sp. Je 1-79]|uniref:NAD-dependent epimerase/dehydratase family protein n=1 Tax=Streptomyces sp. Je 1-79 TaxID=2943847 RepID=UPI0021A3CEC4|nr:NAD(P)-dependent oxidoreductase [Streptomyces sp. Je 1-79]MCT4356216.1 NAD(P)-dependent oxidoreductase [Streptomyces sp. Je 1-79]
MTRTRHSVLVVGGSGFIGGAVVRALLRTTTDDAPAPTAPGAPAFGTGTRGAPGTPAVTVLCRRPPEPPARDPRLRYVTGDLTDPRTLRGVCSGATTVVHAASYVGGDADRCREINHLGTLALLEEARRAGVRRLLYVSTAAVYGSGPHRGPTEEETVPAPQSAASASRLAAEHAVLRAGGLVLRPHLVYGPGDRWFVPTLARLLHLVPCWPREPSAHSSVVHVDDLAATVAALVGEDTEGEGSGLGEGAGGGIGGGAGGGVFHVAHPRPESAADLVATTALRLGLPAPDDVSAAEHRRLTARAVPALSAHQYDLLTQDHWYDSSRILRRTGVEPGPGFAARFPECADWYRKHLAGVPTG